MACEISPPFGTSCAHCYCCCYCYWNCHSPSRIQIQSVSLAQRLQPHSLKVSISASHTMNIYAAQPCGTLAMGSLTAQIPQRRGQHQHHDHDHKHYADDVDTWTAPTSAAGALRSAARAAECCGLDAAVGSRLCSTGRAKTITDKRAVVTERPGHCRRRVRPDDGLRADYHRLLSNVFLRFQGRRAVPSLNREVGRCCLATALSLSWARCDEHTFRRVANRDLKTVRYFERYSGFAGFSFLFARWVRYLRQVIPSQFYSGKSRLFMDILRGNTERPLLVPVVSHVHAEAARPASLLWHDNVSAYFLFSLNPDPQRRLHSVGTVGIDSNVCIVERGSHALNFPMPRPH